MNRNFKTALKALVLPTIIIGVVLAVVLVNQNLLNFINREAAAIREISTTSGDDDTFSDVKANLNFFPSITEENTFTQAFNEQIAAGNNYTEIIDTNQTSDLVPGVNFSWVFRTLPQDDYKMEYFIQEGNIELVREEFNWGEIEKTRGVKDYSRYDEVMQKYQENDVKVVGLLAYSAPWASTAPSNIANEREFYYPNIDDWKNFVRETVSRYKGKIYAWEIWNEPNEPYFFRNTQSQYYNLLKETYPLIKNIDPHARVINGGITWPDPAYIQNFYNNGMGNYSDGFTTHVYYCDQGIATGNYGKMRDDLERAYGIMQAGNPRHKIWITEVGCSSYKYSEEQQAEQLVKKYTTLKSLSYIENAMWYVLRDTNIGAEAGKYGLVTSDFQYKPAWSAWNEINK